MWIKVRGISGEYQYQNTETGEIRNTIPIEQSTTIKKPQIIETEKMSDIAGERAVRKRQERRQNSKFDEEQDKLKTQIAISQIEPSKLGYIADVIDGAMMGSMFLPYPLNMAGNTYYGMKGAKHASQDQYFQGAIEAAPILAQPVVQGYNFVKPMIKLRTPETPILTPKNLLKLGDIEVNNPQLAYRQGSNLVDDFLKSGQVRIPEGSYAKKEIIVGNKRFKLGKSFESPIFSQGYLWYGVPKNPGKSELLVTSEPLGIGTKRTTLVESDLNGTFDLRNRFIGNFGRRVQLFEDQLNPNNTTAYRWHPDYGYRKVAQESPMSLKFYERPSKISEAERLGLPKSERFLPLNINDDINTTITYGESPERQQLFKKILNRAKLRGYIKDPSLFELEKRAPLKPKIKVKLLNSDIYGKYTPKTNTITLNKNGYKETTPYHELLHYNRVGHSPSFLYNKEYQLLNDISQIMRRPNINQVNKQLDIINEHKQLDKYYNDAVNKLVFPDTPAYFRDPKEFVVYGLEAGKSVGLQPFQEAPNVELIYKYFDKAVKKNPWLSEIDKDKASPYAIWKVLTGNYLPLAVIGGLYNSKD